LLASKGGSLALSLPQRQIIQSVLEEQKKHAAPHGPPPGLFFPLFLPNTHTHARVDRFIIASIDTTTTTTRLDRSGLGVLALGKRPRRWYKGGGHPSAGKEGRTHSPVASLFRSDAWAALSISFRLDGLESSNSGPLFFSFLFFFGFISRYYNVLHIARQLLPPRYKTHALARLFFTHQSIDRPPAALSSSLHPQNPKPAPSPPPPRQAGRVFCLSSFLPSFLPSFTAPCCT
jgi:hypothetical protein